MAKKAQRTYPDNFFEPLKVMPRKTLAERNTKPVKPPTSALELAFAELWAKAPELLMQYYGIELIQPMIDIMTLRREYQFHPCKKWAFDYVHVNDKGEPYTRVAIEIDGGQYIKGGGAHQRGRFSSDAEKLNHAQAHGWIVLRYTSKQLATNPALVLRQITCLIMRRAAAPPHAPDYSNVTPDEYAAMRKAF